MTAVAPSINVDGHQYVYGTLTGSNIFDSLRTAVREAAKAIKLTRRFVVHTKGAGSRKSLFTTADQNAQRIFVNKVTKALPGVGLIGEESDQADGDQPDYIPLRRPCTIPDREIYVIVDPLDGTNAFIRREDGGVATMCALVEFFADGSYEVLCALVYNVFTGVLYSYEPGSNEVCRQFDDDTHERLDLAPDNQPWHDPTATPLREQYAMLRRRPQAYHPLIQRLTDYPQHGGLVQGILVEGGSIALTMTRLWIGQVGMVVMPAFDDTPWDMAPIIGISQKLGYRAYRPVEHSDGTATLKRTKIVLRPDITPRCHNLVIVHGSREAELLAWANQSGPVG